MPYIVVIDKMGAVKETNIKEYKESDLFKKAGFKSAEGFVLQHTWQDSSPERGEISVYAKKNGKAGQENKYEFPPPIDSVLFFGSCVLVKRQNGAVVDFRLTEWNRIYDKLMGGFEDLGSADDDDAEGDTEEEELLANGAKLGKEGYILDDFIVEDDRDEEDYDAFSESSNSEKEIEKKKKKKVVKKPSDKDKDSTKEKVSSKKKEKNTIIPPLVEERKEEMYLDCESELVEEAYV